MFQNCKGAVPWNQAAVLFVGNVVLQGLCQAHVTQVRTGFHSTLPFSLGSSANARRQGCLSGWKNLARRSVMIWMGIEGNAGGNDEGVSSEAIRVTAAQLSDMECWLERNGVNMRGGHENSPCVSLSWFSGWGVGLEATRELERDSTVASIPRRICLTSDPADAPQGSLRAWAHGIFPATCCKSPYPLQDHPSSNDIRTVTLQLFLEQAAGSHSEFAPWLAALPQCADTLNLPALWPENDLAALMGTLVFGETLSLLQQANEERDAVVQALTVALEACLVPESVQEERKPSIGWGWGGTGDTSLKHGPRLSLERLGDMTGRPTKEEWLLARCVVQSRAYRIGGRRPGYMLIPLVDFANHDDSLAYAVCPGDGIFTGSNEVVLTTDRVYHPYQQVFTSYGDMDNVKRLFSFGYVMLTLPPKGGVKVEEDGGGSASRQREKARDLIVAPSHVHKMALPLDATCEVSLPLLPSDPLVAAKSNALDLGGITGDGHKEGKARVMTACFDLAHRPPLEALVAGPGGVFVEALMPILRVLVLKPEDFAVDGLRALVNVSESRTGGRGRGTGEEASMKGMAMPTVHKLPAFMGGLHLVGKDQAKMLLTLLQRPVSEELELRALSFLSAQCREKLQSLHLSPGDLVELESVETRGKDEQSVLSVTRPRSLLCATARVGEAIAWKVILEACLQHETRTNVETLALEELVWWVCNNE
ncbi:unnamed protein product [Discosporangium mesarthrocarpum]